MRIPLMHRWQGAIDARSFSLFLALGINAFGAGMFFPFAMLYYQAATSLPVSTIGGMLSVATALTLIVTPLAGVLVDRRRARPIVVMSLCVMAAGFVAYLMVSSAMTLFVAALLATGGSRGFYAAFSSLIAESVEDAARDRWYGLVGVTQNVGASVSGVLASLVIGSAGERGFRLVIVSNIGCLLIAAFLIYLGRSVRDVPPETAPDRVDYRTVLCDRPFLLLIASNLFTVWGSMLVGIGLAVYATEALGAPLWAVGAIGMVQTGLTVCLQTRVTDRLQHMRRTRAMLLAGVMFVAAAIGLAGAVLLQTSMLVPYLVLVLVVFSAAQWCHGPGSRALAAGMAPAAGRGRYIASFELSWGLAAAATPVTFGALYGKAAALPWLAMAGFMLVAMLLVRVAEPTIPLAQNRPQRNRIAG